VKPPELRLAVVVSTPFQQNAYVAQVEGRQDCLVIDPGLEPEKILAHLDGHGLVPAAILNTHAHADHIGGNAALKQRWGDCPLVIGSGDAPKLTDAALNLSAAFGMPVVSPPADVTVKDGDTYSAAGLDLRVREIPGHSAGHVVFLWLDHDPAVAFVGDVIFAGSIGRTDFPDGDYEQLVSGIHEKLFSLPDQTVLLSGHGPQTTVGQEKRGNPFVRLGPSGW
jgi:glyoxylase-like metal-dependent hydrolase (beta-lactamase superfamily II)